MKADRKLTKHRKLAAREEYDLVMNQARNTFKVEEADILELAGYSGRSVADKWRKDDRFPLLAVNAVRGLLQGRETSSKSPNGLLISTRDLETIASALLQASNPKLRPLRASIYKELARRCEQ